MSNLGLELLCEVESDLAVAAALVLQDEGCIHVDGEGGGRAGGSTGLHEQRQTLD